MDYRKILVIFVIIIGSTSSSNEEEIREQDKTVNYSSMESPFRSQKCNMLWNKAV